MTILPTPADLRAQLPAQQTALSTVSQARTSLKEILTKEDDRLILIVGPCSIHHPEFALYYAEKLRKKSLEHQDTLCIVMRAYVEKSRTSTGWKGFINDPDLNNTFNIEKGLTEARKLFLALNNMGVPVATEVIHPYTALYLEDLISFATIGARTSESQMHREFAASLSLPVGFKNTTNGNIQVAIDAVKTANAPHHFFSPDLSGKMQLLHAQGNPYAHVILRGSHTHTNYDLDTIEKTAAFSPVIVDCSHGNSQKNPALQKTVAEQLARLIKEGGSLSGIMLESYLRAGNQVWNPHTVPTPDQSITDGCLAWEETAMLLDVLSEAVQLRKKILVE